MKEIYCIKSINTNIFIKDIKDSEVILTSEFNNVLSFDKVGEAIITAAQTNELLGTTVFKVLPYSDTTVSNNL